MHVRIHCPKPHCPGPYDGLFLGILIHPPSATTMGAHVRAQTVPSDVQMLHDDSGIQMLRLMQTSQLLTCVRTIGAWLASALSMLTHPNPDSKSSIPGDSASSSMGHGLWGPLGTQWGNIVAPWPMSMGPNDPGDEDEDA